jgi:hypothetical protein
MFNFKHEPELAMLTATRRGLWSVDTVVAYEVALRRELALLKASSGPTSFIIDIRSTVAQPLAVAEALRTMVAGLGELHADRTAVVSSSGIAQLQARQVANLTTEVFPSMAPARDWVLRRVDPKRSPATVHDEASEADAEGRAVHVHGPSDVDVVLTPQAALETAKRISDAAVEVLLAGTEVARARERLAA